MKIRFFHRHPACGFSIYKVFQTIESEISKEIEMDEVFMPSPRSMPWDIIINSRFTFKNRNEKGINHISGHIHDVILGLLGCKTVLTIHDLVFIDNVSNPFKRMYKWLFWLYIPIRLANRVTCISSETKRKVLKHIRTDKLTVIYNPIDPSFQYVPKKFAEDRPRILHIGTFWNKNLIRTIQALRGISCHLRIIGKVNDEVLNLLKENEIDFSLTNGLSDEEIRKEYIECDIVNFPSIYEGFGMPIIEGQQTGRVVVASHIEPLIEISGEGVQYVDPNSIDSIRNAYLKLIADSNLRNMLIRKGLENVRRFRVDVIANQYLNLYSEIAIILVYIL